MINLHNIDQYQSIFAQAKEANEHLSNLEKQRQKLYAEISELDTKIYESSTNNQYLRDIINIMIREDLDPLQASLMVEKNPRPADSFEDSGPFPTSKSSYAYAAPAYSTSITAKRASIRKGRR